MVLGTILGAVAGPLIGGAASSIFGGGGGGSSSAGQRTAEVFEPQEDEVLNDFVDNAFGLTNDVVNRGNLVFNNPERTAGAALSYQDFLNNQLSGVRTGRQGPITAGLNLQNFIQTNNLFDTDPEKFGGDLTQIQREFDKVVVPKQNEEQVRRAFETTFGRAPTGNELLKYTGRLEGGVPGYDYGQLVSDITQTPEYKDTFGDEGAIGKALDIYYGDRIKETVPVPESEQQEYQRPSLDAIRKRYGLGPDFGGYDVFKARQAGYSDDEIVKYLKQNPNYLAGKNVVGGEDDFIRRLQDGTFRAVDEQGRGQVPIDRGETPDFKYQAGVGPTKEVITSDREYSFAPDNFTNKSRRLAGLKPIEDFTFTGTVAEIQDFQQQRRDERQYLYNSGLTSLQGDIDKSLQRIKDSGRERLAVIQGQYGMVAGLANGFFS